jgi:hypothetical protein
VPDWILAEIAVLSKVVRCIPLSPGPVPSQGLRISARCTRPPVCDYVTYRDMDGHVVWLLAVPLVLCRVCLSCCGRHCHVRRRCPLTPFPKFPSFPMPRWSLLPVPRTAQSSVRVKIVVKLVIAKIVGAPMDFVKVRVRSACQACG